MTCVNIIIRSKSKVQLWESHLPYPGCVVQRLTPLWKFVITTLDISGTGGGARLFTRGNSSIHTTMNNSALLYTMIGLSFDLRYTMYLIRLHQHTLHSIYIPHQIYHSISVMDNDELYMLHSTFCTTRILSLYSSSASYYRRSRRYARR